MRWLLLICSCFSLFAEPTRILIGSPIRQKPAILKEFLQSLEDLETSSLSIDYFFIDDNEEKESREMLQAFQKGRSCKIIQAEKSEEAYVCTEETHHWKPSLVWKVASFKDQMIEEARQIGFDYLFLLDSDLVLHPKTLKQLIQAEKEIVSNIFWTSWNSNQAFLPQVWLKDHYTQYEFQEGEQLSQEEILQRQFAFLAKMRVAGTYEVGGLGACTLIDKKALQKPISFRKIKNVSLWGEDRHFCIRAQALGIDLYVDTHYPAYHIYRESALVNVADYRRSCQIEKTKGPRVTLSMIVRNEADHYLRRMLNEAKQVITDAVIIDDASTDETVAVCEELLADIPHTIIKNSESKFHNEIELRKQQWQETIRTNPDWILCLDADQILESKAKQVLKQLVQRETVDAYYFRLYDFWDETHYRDDAYWKAHETFRPFLVRYRPDVPYEWGNDNRQHCGHFPSTVYRFLGSAEDLAVKHYGWASPEGRLAKYERYKKLDPEAKYGIQEQYNSILDPAPHLVLFDRE